MSSTDWLGCIGVFQILLAYFLNVSGTITSKALLFILLNLIGSAMACLASVLLNYVPFIVLEGAWAAVSLVSLINYKKNPKVSGETDISKLIRGMAPKLNKGEYVFATVNNLEEIHRIAIICEFKEPEGITVVIERKKADELRLSYTYTASWITLMVHSSLDAVGLTAAFSNALTKHNISCNVISGYYHDHIFVDKKKALKAMDVLNALAEQYK